MPLLSLAGVSVPRAASTGQSKIHGVQTGVPRRTHCCLLVFYIIFVPYFFFILCPNPPILSFDVHKRIFSLADFRCVYFFDMHIFSHLAGDHGYFYVERGTDVMAFESMAVAALPVVSDAMHVHAKSDLLKSKII